MPNNRIFYACQAVAIEPQYYDANGVLTSNANSLVAVHGVQSVGINTTFNLEQVFELGQVQIYENIEGIPEVEVTLEKVLDGYPLIYHLASSGVASGVPSNLQARSSLIARSKERCNVYLGIWSDSYDSIGENNTNALTEVLCSGMYFNSLSYTLPVDGNCTESVTLVGNNKVWNTTGTKKFTSAVASSISGTDVPTNLKAGSPFGGIQRRENVDIKNSILPTAIEGVIGSGVGNAWNSSVNSPRVHIQNCTISTDLGREDILELGRKTPYARPANYPVEVTCELEIIAISGDLISAYEGGDPSNVNTVNAGNNTPEERILIRLNDGTVFNLGSKNRLSSVNYTGGDAGGGNASITYSYSTFNELYVTMSGVDPANAQDPDSYGPIFNAGAWPTTTTTTTAAP